MKSLPCVVLFLFIIIQPFARSLDPQAERRLTKGSPFGVKRIVPPAEFSGKRNLWVNLLDPHAQAEQDQDACMWRCQDWCRDKCRKGGEECLDECLNTRGHRWRRCLRKCKRGDLDRPGGEESEEEEEEEEEEE